MISSRRSLLEDRQGVLWVGTLGGGLSQFDQATQSFLHYQTEEGDPESISNNSIRAIYQDQSGALWIGTEYGLNKFDRTRGRFKRYEPEESNPQSLSEGAVLSIYQDRSGVLWIGTFGGGLNKFDRESESFQHYLQADGLASDVVYGILEDDSGNLWLSTNGGLSKFDPISETFRNYDVSDGLQSNEFNAGAYFQNDSGEMFFGGVEGLNAFFPDLIMDNPYAPQVVLTSLTHNGEAIDVGKAPENVNNLIFNWPDNSFEFEFAALSYRQPQKNKYAYMLEGFDQIWNEIETSRFGKYTNLPAGTYILRMTASNSDDLWSEEGLSIEITIGQPMWQSWPFIAIMVILVAAVGLALYRLRIMSIEARSQELEVEVENRTAELKREIDQRLKVEEVLRQSEMEKAIVAERSRLARDLHDAVTQTLFSASLIAEALPSIWNSDQDEGGKLLEELRLLSRGAQAEMRTLLMELRPDTLVEAKLSDLMRQLAETVMGRKGIPVEVEVVGECPLPSEVHVAIYRITQEALNNVVKHSDAKRVTLRLHCLERSPDEKAGAEQPQRVELSVSDDGRGFDPSNTRSDRLGLGGMRERAAAIGAELEIESEEGAGTEVRVVWEGDE
jgi:signal transduction histidine kinase/sugar lactone lactonase YvrE